MQLYHDVIIIGAGLAGLRAAVELAGSADIAVVSKVLRDLEARVKEWDECKKLEKSFIELKRVEKNLKDELAVISLRRIVPGRCRYCP